MEVSTLSNGTTRPKVALVTLGDSRREFYQSRMTIVTEETEIVVSSLSRDFEVYQSPIVYTDQEAEAVAQTIRNSGIQAVILFLPIWGTPSLAFRIAQSTNRPVAVLGNKRRDSSSLVVLLAVAGMLDQCGKPCIRIAGDLREEPSYRLVADYVHACTLAEEIRKSEFCMIGGRSIGIGTTVADPSQWERVFGTGFDHADQFEIYYRAQAIPQERVTRHTAWVREQMRIEPGGRFTEESLERQVRSYLALKDMVGERGYDFLGIKCQQEMSDHYALQCLAVALLNNDRDADGPKKPVPTSCECDCDGAMTMRLLSLAAGGSPSCLVDIKYFSAQERAFTLANCGSMAPWFTDPLGREPDYRRHVTMMQHSFGLAGGGALQMIAAEGDVTVARLFRSNGQYVLGCFTGKAVSKPISELRKTTWCYPHLFVEADIDYERFFQTMNSNHLHSVYGNHLEVLRLFCDMTGIRFISYNQNGRS